MSDLINAGVTTPHSDTGGLTPFDRLAAWAGDVDGCNVCNFDADDAEEIVALIERLVSKIETQ